MPAVRLHDIARLRVARGELGGPLSWAPYPWFADVRALAALDDGGVLVAGAAGLTRMAPGLERCTWRDDTEPLVDLAHGPHGLLAAGDSLSFWPHLGAAARRCPPAQIGLYAAPHRVCWHPVQPRAAVADVLGQIVVVSLERGEWALERVVGDVPRVDGLAWDLQGRTLAIAGARGDRAGVWLWSAEEGLRERPPIPLRGDDSSHCAAAFAPGSGKLYAFCGEVLVVDERGAWRRELDLGDRHPSSGRFLGSVADDRLIGAATHGVHLFDLKRPATAAWYLPETVPLRAWGESPCCSVRGGHVLLGTSEGLLVSSDRSAGEERFCWGVPPPSTLAGHVSLAPDASAVALADGHDRVAVWHLSRATTPVKVRSWEAAGVTAWWHRSSRGLRIHGVEGRRALRLGDWWRLDRGEGEAGSRDDDAPSSAPDSEFVAPGPSIRSHAGWTVTTGESTELRGPGGERVRLEFDDLPRLYDAAFTPEGELVIVGASTSERHIGTESPCITNSPLLPPGS